MNGLGDTVATALKSVGVTPQRVSAWLGGPCGCEERQRKLNALGWWAQRVLAGRFGPGAAAEYLDSLTMEDDL